MYEVCISNLKAGDILAKSVTSKNGNTILRKGIVLTNHYIKRLFEMNIEKVFIQNMDNGKINKESRNEKQSIYKKLFYLLENDTTQFFMAEKKNNSHFKKKFQNALIEITSEPKLVDFLCNLYNYDQSLFDHSCKVSILSAMIGMEFNYDNARFLELTMGSLFFDIGMTTLPRLETDSSNLIEQDHELIKSHTINGYNMMKAIKGMPDYSAQCALFHHERFDGSGYPFRLANGIPEYAQIIGMCDIYYKLLSNKSNQKPFRAEEVIEFFYAAGDYYFHADLVQMFLRHITAYPVSSVLKLSSGQKGVVQSYSSRLLHRPVIRIIEEANGLSVPAPYEIDLAVEKDITVMQVSM